VEFTLVRQKFDAWLSQKDPAFTPPADVMKISRHVEDMVFGVVDLPSLIVEFFRDTNLLHKREGGLALSIESLLIWFQWSIMERLPNYDVLEHDGFLNRFEPSWQTLFSRFSTPQGMSYQL
jgi:hypothetical protein